MLPHDEINHFYRRGRPSSVFLCFLGSQTGFFSCGKESLSAVWPIRTRGYLGDHQHPLYSVGGFWA